MSTIVFSNNLTKEYKTKKETVLAVNQVSFNVEEGQIVGLVGPNGAGKSTIIKMICGILHPTSGELMVLGMDPSKERKKVIPNLGVMFGNRSSLWYNLPALDSVRLMRYIYGIDKHVFDQRLKKYVAILNASDILDKPVRQMSLGQKVKIELLVTVLHNPKLLILDEPTLGLDILTKSQFRDALVNLAMQQTTIILTTHDLSDVEKICDHIIFINHGKKLLDLQNAEFQQMMDQFEVILLEGNEKTLEGLERDPFFRERIGESCKFFVPKKDKKEFMERVLREDDLLLKTQKPTVK